MKKVYYVYDSATGKFANIIVSSKSLKAVKESLSVNYNGNKTEKGYYGGAILPVTAATYSPSFYGYGEPYDPHKKLKHNIGYALVALFFIGLIALMVKDKRVGWPGVIFVFGGTALVGGIALLFEYLFK